MKLQTQKRINIEINLDGLQIKAKIKAQISAHWKQHQTA